ncbi:uncharacterized protein APUU_11559S [Aspergillus puulaauensis]|uniref:Rhodopsin domain-containing protein n=1 Tax=Aspergillus puulaauensis TaxID=1220207 RepID=A0A7R8AH72_9EURO|nr:uncharacterized protein APUU_11559S [Aspergillus puulaauensis]BCS18731.1 hypothetical protein APUU_11559S [Aspergillus puulaauensis]
MASPYISQQGLSALMWIGIILSIIFVAIRTHVQYRYSGRFFVNDYWIFFAIVCHLATAIVYQIAIPPMYEVQTFDPETQAMDAAFMDRASLFLRLQFAVDFLLWTTLWTVKFSLLSFFWRLFDSVRSPMKVFWWTMCAVTASTWVTLVVLQNLACDPIRNFFTLGKCSSARDVYYSNLVFKFTVGTDIAGDILIMLIPFPLLHTLQIPPGKKYILAAIFSLPLIPILFAVLRLVIANPDSGNVDPVKFQLYSMLENSSAIVTSCLPSLRLFVVKQGSGLGSHSYRYRSRSRSKYNKKNRYPGYNLGGEYVGGGQGDFFGNSEVHGHRDGDGGVGASRSRSRCESTVEAFGLETMGSRGGNEVLDGDEDAGTDNSGESRRGIVGGRRGVLVTREFSVR